jgi:hypothetical protein
MHIALARAEAKTRMLSVFAAMSVGLMLVLAPSMANASTAKSHESSSPVKYQSTKVILTKEGDSRREA